MPDERRNFTRVPFHIYVEIQYLGQVITGQVVDLSLKGFFVQSEQKIALGEELDVKLRMPSTNPPLEFRLRAETIRATTEGIGLKIIGADVQAFTHLRNIVAMQSNDPDRVLDELLPKE